MSGALVAYKTTTIRPVSVIMPSIGARISMTYPYVGSSSAIIGFVAGIKKGAVLTAPFGLRVTASVEVTI